MWLNGQHSHPSLGWACCMQREKGSCHCSPFFLVPNFHSSSTQIAKGGRGGKGAGEFLLNSISVNELLLSCPARWLNLTLFCCGSFGNAPPFSEDLSLAAHLTRVNVFLFPGISHHFLHPCNQHYLQLLSGRLLVLTGGLPS